MAFGHYIGQPGVAHDLYTLPTEELLKHCAESPALYPPLSSSGPAARSWWTRLTRAGMQVRFSVADRLRSLADWIDP